MRAGTGRTGGLTIDYDENQGTTIVYTQRNEQNTNATAAIGGLGGSTLTPNGGLYKVDKIFSGDSYKIHITIGVTTSFIVEYVPVGKDRRCRTLSDIGCSSI